MSEIVNNEFWLCGSLFLLSRISIPVFQKSGYPHCSRIYCS